MSSSKLDAFPLFITPSLRFSWFTCGPSCSVSARRGFVVRFSDLCFSLNPVSNTGSVLTLISFVRRQAQFGQFLSGNSTLSASRYFRLMALACTEVLFTIPMAIFSIVLNTTNAPIMPWISWEDTHYNFGRVGQVPAVLWRSNPRVAVAYILTKWSCVICAFIFFIFFGLAPEARRHYSTTLNRLLLVCRLKKPASPTNEKSGYVNDCSLLPLSHF